MKKRIYLKQVVDRIIEVHKLGTRKELSRIAGISDGTLSNWVNEDVDRMPQFDFLIKLLDCPILTPQEREELAKAYLKDQTRRLGYDPESYNIPVSMIKEYGPLLEIAKSNFVIKHCLDSLNDTAIKLNEEIKRQPRIVAEDSDDNYGD